ncbi:MAG: hypothetical protein WC650_02655 [Candidatus Doudnabacteria bacterium]
MTPTEVETLEIIWQNKGKASLFEIARELKVSTDYCRLICRGLLENKVIELFQREYRVTDLGKEKLEEFQLIEKAPQAKRVVRPKKLRIKKEKEKVTTYHSKPQIRSRIGLGQSRIKLRSNSKLNTGQAITELSNLAPESVEVLREKGFLTLEDVATSSVTRLMEALKGLELKQAADIINRARAKLRKEGREYLWEGLEL